MTNHKSTIEYINNNYEDILNNFKLIEETLNSNPDSITKIDEVVLSLSKQGKKYIKKQKFVNVIDEAKRILWLYHKIPRLRTQGYTEFINLWFHPDEKLNLSRFAAFKICNLNRVPTSLWSKESNNFDTSKLNNLNIQPLYEYLAGVELEDQLSIVFEKCLQASMLYEPDQVKLSTYMISSINYGLQYIKNIVKYKPFGTKLGENDKLWRFAINLDKFDEDGESVQYDKLLNEANLFNDLDMLQPDKILLSKEKEVDMSKIFTNDLERVLYKYLIDFSTIHKKLYFKDITLYKNDCLYDFPLHWNELDERLLKAGYTLNRTQANRALMTLINKIRDFWVQWFKV